MTGGIGAGKSEALRAFRRAGADTLCLDEVSRRLSSRGKPVNRAIVKAFGSGVLDFTGRIDRKKLGKIVFRNPRSRKKLEDATHPAILREMKKHLKNHLEKLKVTAHHVVTHVRGTTKVTGTCQ